MAKDCKQRVRSTSPAHRFASALGAKFEVDQTARQVELSRLQGLLKQSDTRLNARQTRRAEIVGKRLHELLPLLPGNRACAIQYFQRD